MKIRTLAAALALAFVPALALVVVPALAFAADAPPPTPGAGYRALSLPLPAHQLRFIEVGERVDVLVTFEAPLGKKGDESKEEVTATILQNVRVLAVDRKEGVLALELNPNETQYAALFSSKDKVLWVSKRAKGDAEMHPMEMASAKKLFR